MAVDDQPEMDKTDVLEMENRELYQILIEISRWEISLERIDILQAIMVISRFQSEPRESHLKRMLRVFGYLKKYPSKAIFRNTKVPDFVPP